MASSRKLVELPEAPTADPSDLLLIHDISADIDKKITAQNLPFSGGTGIQGVTGFQGQTGYQGQTGIQGGTGIQGVTGLQGPGGGGGSQGATGFQGQTGLLGQTGIQGGTGIQGETGIQGPGGSGGSQGATGLQGGTGIQGQTGASLALSLTADYLPKAATSTTLSNSVIYETGGNIGIDTTSPYVPGIGSATGLDIRGTDGASITLASTSQGTTPALCAYGYVLGGVIRVAIAQPLAFHTNSSERMIITSAGDVGVGTSTPYSIFELSKAGTIKSNTDFLSITNTVNAADMISTATSLLFRQWYYDVSTPAVSDCGRIGFEAISNWTSAASTRNSMLTIGTSYDGTIYNTLKQDSLYGTLKIMSSLATNAISANQMTAFGITESRQFGEMRAYTSANLGLIIRGFRINDSEAITLRGYSTAQSSGQGNVAVESYLYDGTTGTTDIGNTYALFSIANRTAERLKIWGNGSETLHAASLAHGMTDYLPTDAWFRVTPCTDSNPEYGGAKIIGASYSTGPGLSLYAIGQSSCSIHSLFDIITGKANGTGITDLVSSDHALRLLNNLTELLVVHGNGDTTIKGIVTAETTKRVACGGDSTGSTTTASGTVTLEINGTTYYLLRAAGA